MDPPAPQHATQLGYHVTSKGTMGMEAWFVQLSNAGGTLRIWTIKVKGWSWRRMEVEARVQKYKLEAAIIMDTKSKHPGWTPSESIDTLPIVDHRERWSHGADGVEGTGARLGTDKGPLAGFAPQPPPRAWSRRSQRSQSYGGGMPIPMVVFR